MFSKIYYEGRNFVPSLKVMPKSKTKIVPKKGPVPKEGKRLPRSFFTEGAVEVSEKLVGKILCRRLENGEIIRRRITETEAYFGENDSACHARFGKTERNSVMYKIGGHVYVYLCYGIHYMLNLVTGPENHPEASLIRGVEGAEGPGKLTKLMNIDKTLYGTDMITSDSLWVEDDGFSFQVKKTKRIGIDYATEVDRNKLWRFVRE